MLGLCRWLWSLGSSDASAGRKIGGRSLGAWCAAVAMVAAFGASAAPPGKLYPGFVVHPHGEPQPEFEFSEAYATSASPVVVSAVGRKLRRSDLEYRTSLQKRWLAEYVPDDMQLVMREQVECDYRPDRKYPRCDRYEFAGAGRTLEIYFYLSHWP